MNENVIDGGTEEEVVFYNKDEEISELEGIEENIIFIFYNDNLVMTFDSKKKVWEFPSGKKENNETMLECIYRVAFEKTGAILESAFPIGCYATLKDSAIVEKAIFFGKATRFETRPEWSEADLVKLFDELPQETADKIMYSTILDYIKLKYE